MIKLRFGSKPEPRCEVHLTDSEAMRLRDYLLGRFPPVRTTPQISDVGQAAMAVEAARAKGKQ